MASSQSSRRNLISDAFGVRSSECSEFGELAVEQEFGSQSDSECMRASMNAEKAAEHDVPRTRRYREKQ